MKEVKKVVRHKDNTISEYIILCDDEDYELVKTCTICESNRRKYAAVRTKDRGFLARYLLGLEKGNKLQADHINGNPLDNRKENLRAVEQKVNTRNIEIRENQIYYGVRYDKHHNYYEVKLDGFGRKSFKSKHESIRTAYEFVSKNWDNKRQPKTLEQILEENPEHIYDQMVKCEKCDKTYKSKHILSLHMKYHEDEPIRCEQCDKILKNKKSYYHHYNNVHKIDVQTCKYCNKEYNNKKKLADHLYKVHRDLK